MRGNFTETYAAGVVAGAIDSHFLHARFGLVQQPLAPNLLTVVGIGEGREQTHHGWETCFRIEIPHGLKQGEDFVIRFPAVTHGICAGFQSHERLRDFREKSRQPLDKRCLEKDADVRYIPLAVGTPGVKMPNMGNVGGNQYDFSLAESVGPVADGAHAFPTYNIGQFPLWMVVDFALSVGSDTHVVKYKRRFIHNANIVQ